MQNQVQYSQNYSSGLQSGIAYNKYTAPNYVKTFDKTLPASNTLKHYASNPNLSMEFANNKQTPLPEQNTHNQYQINKNIEFRAHNNNMNMGFSGTQATSPRPSRHSMTQSLIINDN